MNPCNCVLFCKGRERLGADSTCKRYDKAGRIGAPEADAAKLAEAHAGKLAAMELERDLVQERLDQAGVNLLAAEETLEGVRADVARLEQGKADADQTIAALKSEIEHLKSELAHAAAGQKDEATLLTCILRNLPQGTRRNPARNKKRAPGITIMGELKMEDAKNVAEQRLKAVIATLAVLAKMLTEAQAREEAPKANQPTPLDEIAELREIRDAMGLLTTRGLPHRVRELKANYEGTEAARKRQLAMFEEVTTALGDVEGVDMRDLLGKAKALRERLDLIAQFVSYKNVGSVDEGSLLGQIQRAASGKVQAACACHGDWVHRAECDLKYKPGIIAAKRPEDV